MTNPALHRQTPSALAKLPLVGWPLWSDVQGAARRMWTAAGPLLVLLLIMSISGKAADGQEGDGGSSAKDRYLELISAKKRVPEHLRTAQAPVGPGGIEGIEVFGDPGAANIEPPLDVAYGAPAYGPVGYGPVGYGLLGRPYWLEAEYMPSWIKGMNAPPLVTASSMGTPITSAGVLGQTGTTILSSGETMEDSGASGLRLAFGFGLGPCASLEGIYSYYGDSNDEVRFNSFTHPILARPFYNVEPGQEGPDAELISFPGTLQGEVVVSNSSRMEGAEALYHYHLLESQDPRVSLVAGLRYMRLEETLAIFDTRQIVGTGTGLAVGTTFSETDLFETENRFSGVQVGVLTQLNSGRLSLDGILKVALGENRARVTILGSSTSSVPLPGAPPDITTSDSGLLAQATNIGNYSQNEFAVVPELGFRLGCQIRPWLRGTLGYRFVYWSRVARPGNHIDPNLNLSQLAPTGLVGIPRPEFRWQIDDVWVHSLTVGLDGQF